MSVQSEFAAKCIAVAVFLCGIAIALYAYAPSFQDSAAPVEADNRTMGRVISTEEGVIKIATLSYMGSVPRETGERAYVVGEDTVIVRQVLYPRDMFERQLKAFQSGATTTHPVAYYEENLSTADMRAGMVVTITPEPGRADTARVILVTLP